MAFSQNKEVKEDFHVFTLEKRSHGFTSGIFNVSYSQSQEEKEVEEEKVKPLLISSFAAQYLCFVFYFYF